MKVIKINDNLKINIEQVYSLERLNNQNEIDEWNIKYQLYLNEFSKDPPLLAIDENNLFQPKFGETNDEELMKKYATALNYHIIKMIDECPVYQESYRVILSTGLKININKIIYDKIDEYMSKYLDE